jgi:hypothetical protein
MEGQVVHFPRSDPVKGELLCQNKSGNPLKNPASWSLLMQVDVAIAPAGDVWVTNGWLYWPAALERVDERLSTLGGWPGCDRVLRRGQAGEMPMVGPPRQP